MRTKQGVITSAKMQDTVTVTVHRSVFHPMYKKRFRSSKKFLADSKGFDLAAGDEVVIAECRPISKNKHFKVTEVVKRAPRVSELQEEGAVADLTTVKQTKTASEPQS
ncbi:MAG: 30S ribosomal protein S17 [Candidatus Peribacteraceae bacterium]|nr:30S ribosomal protein S17 [Candidatus Peribacteraceae bacterium]